MDRTGSDNKLFTPANIAASALAAAVASGDTAADQSLPTPTGRFLSSLQETYNVDEHQHGEAQPQLQVSPITMLKTDFRLEHLNQIAVNQHYICYGLKQGHIRVINKHTATRALLKGHTTMVSDMQFFQPSSNLLASTAKGCDIYVRNISEDESGIHDQVLLKIPLKDTDTASSLCWHPVSSQLLACSVGASLSFVSVPDLSSNSTQLRPVTLPVIIPSTGVVTSLSISKDGRMLAAGTSTGVVKVWSSISSITAQSVPDLQSLSSYSPYQGAAVGTVDFLPTGHLITGDANNEVIKLWAVWGSSEPDLLQTLTLKANSPDSFFNHVCIQPAHNLLVVANSRRTQLITIHYSTTPEGQVAFDYVAEFLVAMPILSMTVPKDLDSGNPDTFTIYCIQTEAIQQYTVYARMCKPTPGASVPKLLPAVIPAAVAPSTVTDNGALAVAHHGVDTSVLPSSAPVPVLAAEPDLPLPAASMMPPDPAHLTGLLTPSLLIRRASSGAHSPGPQAVLASSPNAPSSAAPSVHSPPAANPLTPLSPDTLAPPLHAAPVPAVDVAPHHAQAALPQLPSSILGSSTQPAVPEPAPEVATRATAAAPEPLVDAAAALPDTLLSQEQPASSSTAPTRRKPPLTMSDEVVVAATQQTAPVDPTAAETISELPSETLPTPPAFPEPIANGPASAEVSGRTTSPASTASVLPASAAAAVAAALREVPKGAAEAAVSSSSSVVLEPPPPAVSAVPAHVVVDTGAMAAELDAVKDVLAKVLAAQQELKAELSSSQRSVTNSLRDEVRQGFSRSRSELGDTLGRALEERLSAPLKRAEEDRRKAATNERKDMQRTLEQLVNGMSTALQARLSEMLTQHANTLYAGVSASVDAAVKTSVQAAVASILPTELAGRPLQLALQSALAAQLREALHQPLSAGLRTCFAESVVPSFERATQAMFGQIESHFGSGLAEQLRVAAGGGEQLAVSLRSTLQQAQAVTNSMQSAASAFQSTVGTFQSSMSGFQTSVGSFQTSMTEAVQQVSAAATAAAAAVAAAPAARTAPGPAGMAQTMTLSQIEAAIEAAQDPKQLIRTLINQGKWEDAFLKALSLEDVDSVTWLCKQTDPTKLLGNTPCPLSQIVLLPLVQQLGHDLSKDPEVKVKWILEAANYIDPRHATIAQYAPSILKQARDNLNAVVTSSQGDLSRLCRTATHVVNSLLHQ